MLMKRVPHMTGFVMRNVSLRSKNMNRYEKTSNINKKIENWKSLSLNFLHKNKNVCPEALS